MSLGLVQRRKLAGGKQDLLPSIGLNDLSPTIHHVFFKLVTNKIAKMLAGQKQPYRFRSYAVGTLQGLIGQDS